ncbi:hypothetical protein FB451DRAFT_1387170 [Mycena latifolia]|nr:hypothetical protein FB451DRAFT_1387170 [Mycena latifolia]
MLQVVALILSLVAYSQFIRPTAALANNSSSHLPVFGAVPDGTSCHPPMTMSPPEYELLPSDPEYKLLHTGAAPTHPPAKQPCPLHWLTTTAGAAFMLLAILGFTFAR